MAGPHDQIIANAAKSVLGPLGFVRKGRSRIWTADHHWWVTVVEFQPSSWSKGSYLNVAAHWLWSSEDHISFDFGGRVAEHVEYRSDEQFAPAVIAFAESAAKEAQRFLELFPSLTATAETLLNDLRSSGDRDGAGGWADYNAGVAAGMAGRTDDAAEIFRRISNGFASSDSLLSRNAIGMARLIEQPELFRRELLSLIERHRAALRLPALSGPLI